MAKNTMGTKLPRTLEQNNHSLLINRSTIESSLNILLASTEN